MGELASASVTIVNRLGLHARPATEFVDLASSFKADVWVHKGDERVGGKSIMEMMMLAATKGTNLEIKADGPDAKACVEALAKLVADGFGED
jgi:phosphotransferase system HPr (HPr) family protein